MSLWPLGRVWWPACVVVIAALVDWCPGARATVSSASENAVHKRARFVAAERAFAAGRSEEFRSLQSGLADYSLYPYIEFLPLAKRLDSAGDEAIETFLARYADVPLAARLRGRWLSLLARRGRWAKYVEVYREGHSTKLRCHYVHALLKVGREHDALALVEPLWLVGKSQPDECDAAFAAWRDADGLSNDRVWARIRLAMEKGSTGLAKYLRRYLPPDDRALVDLWLSVRARPEIVADASRFRRDHSIDREIRLWGMLRLARSDVERATKLWASLGDDGSFDEAEQSQVRARIGLSHAYRHEDEANRWFSTLPDQVEDERVREWRVLSALRHQRWSQALHAIEALPHEERSDERWQYWWARATEALGDSEAASRVYRVLMRERSYYGFLSADRQGAPYRFNERSLEFADADLDAMRAVPAVERAHELVQLERWVDARREWYMLLGTELDDEQRAMLAKLADEWGWHGRAIITVARTPYMDDLDLRFPTPHAERFTSRAREHGLDPAWVYAVARQESAFMPDARSPAGALGLMQIMPATGRHIAGKLNASGFRTGQLLDPEVNIRFGTWYLRNLLDRIDDNPILATAGYNAGPHRVDRWMPKGGDLDADIWIETIPFSETRKYVRRVFAYTVIYENRLGLSSTRLSERFTTVGQHGGGGDVPTR